ncbi:MAG TPA: transcription termination/antitermination protein NusA, partial [Desulfobacteraceae bacterium]|nr:transcription termination/antitermination protein NusA [Desulfobacteraceae bacterium]
KIDIVTWDPDPAKFICNALAPAEIIRVVVDEENHSMEVVVHDQLSLAIGKGGQNVRLASRLTGWTLDVVSETNYNKALKEGYQSLLSLEGVGEKLAAELYQEGFRSALDLSQAEPEELMGIEEMTEEKARQLIDEAISFIEKKEEGEALVEEAESEEPVEQSEENEGAELEDKEVPQAGDE